ncbi:MAG: hypothetical protein KKA60_00260 [Proteobacteria bacterium]|nr:hypothetical protein [Pseudomonadota bacterium]
MKQEDAIHLILKYAKSEPKLRVGNYGYDIYIPALMRLYANQIMKSPSQTEEITILDEHFPAIVDAAWELCRRGILRPGVKKRGGQVTPDGSGGNGYSITAFGRQWIEEENFDAFVPTEPERFAQMIEPFKGRLGPGFHERAQQAIRCYDAHAYLACCAMCGAAAESILLAIAIEKDQDEERIIRSYSSAGGRIKIENLIIGKVDERIRREFKGLTDLLKYWRDESAHGRKSDISDNEAYTSIAMLLRFALFSNDNWPLLTK